MKGGTLGGRRKLRKKADVCKSKKQYRIILYNICDVLSCILLKISGWYWVIWKKQKFLGTFRGQHLSPPPLLCCYHLFNLQHTLDLLFCSDHLFNLQYPLDLSPYSTYTLLIIGLIDLILYSVTFNNDIIWKRIGDIQYQHVGEWVGEK